MEYIGNAQGSVHWKSDGTGGGHEADSVHATAVVAFAACREADLRRQAEEGPNVRTHGYTKKEKLRRRGRSSGRTPATCTTHPHTFGQSGARLDSGVCLPRA